MLEKVFFRNCKNETKNWSIFCKKSHLCLKTWSWIGCAFDTNQSGCRKIVVFESHFDNGTKEFRYSNFIEIKKSKVYCCGKLFFFVKENATFFTRAILLSYFSRANIRYVISIIDKKKMTIFQKSLKLFLSKDKSLNDDMKWWQQCILFKGDINCFNFLYSI